MDITINNIDLPNCDIVVPCLIVSKGYQSTTVHIEFKNRQNSGISIKILSPDNSKKLSEFNFWHHENTDLVFYRLEQQWGIIDLSQKSLKRNCFEHFMDFPFFYFHDNCFLIVDDLFAVTVDLKGNEIDRICNEQPHEVLEYEDYFEFDIIGVEKRKLMRKGSR